MTICIAAIAEEKYVVMAADRTLTLNFEPPEFGHETASKLYEVTQGFLMGAAGSPTFVPELLRRLKEFKRPPDEEFPERVAEILSQIRKSRIEQSILRKFGWDYGTYEKYYSQGRLLEAHARKILDEIDTYHVCIHLVTGCVLSNGHATINEIEDPGVVDCGDALGFAAVGSGEAYALQSLIRANFTSGVSLLEAVYQVFEAKKNAEQALGVGRRTDLRIILSPKKNVQLSDDELRGLNEVYQEKTSRQDAIDKEVLELTRKWLPSSLKRYVG